MRVQDVVNFVFILKAFCLDEQHFDAKFVRSLEDKFKELDKGKKLEESQINLLIDIYKSRWNEIRRNEVLNTVYDYTLSNSKLNEVWINFAKKIADVRYPKISYLKVLMHTIENDKDPHDNSDLENTIITDLHLTANGKTICTKLSFYDHLQRDDYALSICSNSNYHIVSIDELSRLRRCEVQASNQPNMPPNFWVFLRENVFANLTKKGRKPMSLLPDLVGLVDIFYQLKATGSNFSEFKNRAKKYFDRLTAHPSYEEINFLYGCKIHYKQQDFYFLDLLLAIYEANSYASLSEEMLTLAKFLFRVNPALKSNRKELDVSYKAWNSDPVIDHKKICCSILVSLYNTSFGSESKFPITAEEGITGLIPNELKQIYEFLHNALSTKVHNYGELYENALKLLPTVPQSSGWFVFSCSWFSKSIPPVVTRWATSIRNSEFSLVGGYWYKPACIIAALSTYKTNNPILNKEIGMLLDDIIQNLYTSLKDHQKKLRINILFARFLTSLSNENITHRYRIVMLTEVQEPNTSEDEFIINCVKHINKRLESIAPAYRGQIILSDLSAIEKIKGIRALPELINVYAQKKTGIHDVDSSINSYLHQLKTNILTTSQKKRAEDLATYEETHSMSTWT